MTSLGLLGYTIWNQQAKFLGISKILWSENGIEYMSLDMTNYLISNVILHQISCVSTP
jgi:hypothetical protein